MKWAEITMASQEFGLKSGPKNTSRGRGRKTNSPRVDITSVECCKKQCVYTCPFGQDSWATKSIFYLSGKQRNLVDPAIQLKQINVDYSSYHRLVNKAIIRELIIQVADNSGRTYVSPELSWAPPIFYSMTLL